MADDPRTKLSPAPPLTQVEPPDLGLPRVPANARRTRSGRLVVIDDPGDVFLRHLIGQDSPLTPRSAFTARTIRSDGSVVPPPTRRSR